MIDSLLTLVLVAGFAVYAWFVARVTRDRLERKNAALEQRVATLERRLEKLEAKKVRGKQ